MSSVCYLTFFHRSIPPPRLVPKVFCAGLPKLPKGLVTVGVAAAPNPDVALPNENGVEVPKPPAVVGFPPNRLVDAVVVVVPKLNAVDEATGAPNVDVPGVMLKPV